MTSEKVIFSHCAWDLCIRANIAALFHIIRLRQVLQWVIIQILSGFFRKERKEKNLFRVMSENNKAGDSNEHPELEPQNTGGGNDEGDLFSDGRGSGAQGGGGRSQDHSSDSVKV